MKRTLRTFAVLCGGRFSGEDGVFTGVSTDTRALRAGEIYFALRGPRFDGNEFLEAAAAAGAVAAVVDRSVSRPPLPVIEVADGQAALSRAAAGWRAGFSKPLLGIAGSNGKTTVKEMTSSILAQRGACLATRGNLNNHIGVPLTLLRLSSEHRAAVIEIGANNPGEVADLVAIAKPTVGLITNAGAEHLEGFGDLDGVARAEGEMVAGLTSADTAVINADDDYAQLWRDMTPASVVTFGVDRPADFRAAGVNESLTDAGFRVTFTLQSPLGERAVQLNVGGRHNVRNATAMQPVSGRLHPVRTRHGARLIDDSYNANPSSMRAGIDVLTQLPGKAWLVMGDMGELGEHASDSHVDIGRYARERGVQHLFATGPLCKLAVEAFGAGATWYADTEALARVVDERLVADVTVLVKGSRSSRLERVVAHLTGTAAKETH
jgi:UDP-N-acetylmuramoyl-tripeptide--D-alanyl-D-alanine ligase